jgi:NAD-dependent dihydropyrimidine dehydrogenase PreA subunit
MGYTVTVDVDKCVGDGECVDVCPVEVYELQGGKAVVVNEEECLGCESCIEVCDQGAITVEEN